MGKKVVIALGGNALGSTPEEQLKLVRNTAESIVNLVEQGYDIVLSHGNGPQVGMVNLAFEQSHKAGAKTPIMPFAECTAMTQGYIGYHLQQAIQRELNKRNIKKDCVCLISQVEVDPNDQAFKNPTKPIGSFYTKEEAEKIIKETGYTFVEDAGRGYRRVVPSPIPQKIVELDTIAKLVDAGTIVISCGGGGIPVVKDEDGYHGVDAVIDKDETSSLLARELKADELVILTNVDYTYLNYRDENKEAIKHMTSKEAKKHIEDNHFAKGSMLPKVNACVKFVEKSDKEAIIAELANAKDALLGKVGTHISKN